VRRGQ